MKKLIMMMLILGLSYEAFAQPKLQPGLWKLSNEVFLGQGEQKMEVTEQVMGAKALIQKQMQEAMKQMSPEQKAKMQEAMGAVDQASQEQTHCLTKEDIQKGLLYRSDNTDGCKVLEQKWTGTTWHLEMNCEHDQHQAHVVVDGTVESDQRYTMKSVTHAKGQTITTNHVGTFVSKTCS
jgi:hypothetical protein